MGLIDIFKKKEKRKEQSKCAQCLRPIAGSVYTIDSNNYCRECYNRKMAVIQQTCGQPATVTQKIPPKKSAQNKLPVAERCARCFDNIPAEQRNSGKLSDHITWKIEKSILYIQGYGTLTRGDYLTITAPAPRFETMTYTNVLPWAVSNTIRQSQYIGEGYNVAEIPTHIEGVVVDSEIEGLKEFLLNADDYVGVQLQSPDEYLCRISVVPGCKQNLNLLVQQLLADIEKIRPSRLSYYEDMFEKTLNGRLNYECTLEYNSTEGTYDLAYWERGHIVGGIKEKSVEDFRFSFFQNEFFTIRIRYIKKDLENMLLELWPLFENKEIIKQRIKAYQAKYELGEFDFETMTFMECADDQHHFVDLKHFNGGSNCKCQKCNLVIQFNRGDPDRIEPKEWKAFIEKYKGSKIDFYYPPYSNEGMKDLVSIWSNWKERLPDYLSKKEYIELGFLSETVEVEPDGYGGIDKIFYFENGAFHTCLRHWDGGNFTANRSYNRTVLCKQDFIKILEDKKVIILCELPNAEKAKFESVFEDVKEILLSFA